MKAEGAGGRGEEGGGRQRRTKYTRRDEGVAQTGRRREIEGKRDKGGGKKAAAKGDTIERERKLQPR